MSSNSNSEVKTKIWEVNSKVTTGLRHMRREMNSQDATGMKRDGDKVSIALVDGIGSSDITAKGMKRIVTLLNEFMIGFFDKFTEEKPDEVAYNLLLQVEREIVKLSEEYDASYRDFASTLLGFCIDEKRNQYVAVHLGDGMILVKDDMDKMKVFSAPINGGKNGTIVSVSEHALEYTGIYRGNLDGIRTIILMSDGVYSKEKNLETFIRSTIKNFQTNGGDDILLSENNQDDQAIITLKR